VELMEQKHLLERVSVDGDARKKKLRLTAEADEVLSDVKKAVEELEERVRASFCAEDYDTLMQLLGQLCTFLDRPENFEEENI
jgi:DNA-binding MarR family transcriptional regulator